MSRINPYKNASFNRNETLNLIEISDAIEEIDEAKYIVDIAVNDPGRDSIMSSNRYFFLKVGGLNSPESCESLIRSFYLQLKAFNPEVTYKCFRKLIEAESKYATNKTSLENKFSGVNLDIDRPMLQICTHSGSFHADEALAVYMLRLLPRFRFANLVRSRNPADWDASDIVVDVSGKYDAVKFFDHHQREFTTTFNEKYQTKLSSAGLVYKHFGREIISTVISLSESVESEKAKIDYLYDKIYSDFIEAVDANDNGIDKYENKDSLTERFKDRNFSIAGMVSNLNPSWESDATDHDFDRQFEIASKLIGDAFFNYLTYMGNSFLKAKQYVVDAFAERFNVHPSGKILLFDRFIPWKEHLFTVEKENKAEGEALFALFPDSSNKWRIAAVPVSASSFDSRKKLPEPWRGLRDDDLSTATGIPGCVFIHAAGFIGGANTKEAVLKLAEMSL